MNPLPSITEVCAVSRFETKSCPTMSAQSTLAGAWACAQRRNSRPRSRSATVCATFSSKTRARLPASRCIWILERRPVLADERQSRDPEAQDERQPEGDRGVTEEPGAVGERRADLRAARHPRRRAGGLPAAFGEPRSLDDRLDRADRRQARRGNVRAGRSVDPGRVGTSFACRRGEKPTHAVRRDADSLPQRLAPDQDHKRRRSRIRPSGASSPAARRDRAPETSLMSRRPAAEVRAVRAKAARVHAFRAGGRPDAGPKSPSRRLFALCARAAVMAARCSRIGSRLKGVRIIRTSGPFHKFLTQALVRRG